jgi:hypothetical protein
MNNVFDIHHQVIQRLALGITEITTDTTTVGVIIDTAGFTILELLVISSILAGGVYTSILEHGDDSGLSDAAAVPVDEVLGSAVFTSSGVDNFKVKHIGYIGGKRYVRLSIVSVGAISGTLGALSVLGGSSHQPTAD